MEKFKNYINGVWTEAESGKYFQNISPANHKDIIGEFPLSEQADVDKAVAIAKEAYKSWRLMPAPKRGDILRKAGDIFVARKKELAKVMTREMGKPTFETEGDVQEAIDTCYYAATETRRLFGHTVPSEMENKMNLSFRTPIGVCGIITAWNFPIAVPSWKIIPALACGNTIVFKPAEESPHSANIFAEIMEEAGLPKGVFNVVHGYGEQCGEAMINHKDIKLIGFTGSTEVGKHIAGVCGASNKKCSLEMGGKNAMIVMPDANMDLVIDGALWGAFGTTGQRCTATSRAIVHEDVYDEFIEKLTEKAKALKIGDGLKPETEMGPLIHDKSLQNCVRAVREAREQGARVVCGGNPATEGDLANGSFFEPTVIADVVPGKHTLFHEEIFGPILAVTKTTNFKEAIEMQNDCEYGLSSSLYTKDVNKAFTALRDIEAGITYINAPTIGAEAHMPFGGIKGTGNGHREGGWTAFEIFTEWKTVYVDYSDTLQRAQIDNYD